MVLTWHLQRTIKSWILFVRKVKDLYTHWLHWIFKKLWHLFGLEIVHFFYHKLIALQNWIKHNDHCTLVIGGCIFGESQGNWIVMRVVTYYLLLILQIRVCLIDRNANPDNFVKQIKLTATNLNESCLLYSLFTLRSLTILVNRTTY